MADVIKRVDPRVAAFHDMDVVLGAWKTELVQAMHGDTADDDAPSSTHHSDVASGQPELQCQRDVAATRLKTAKRTATIRRGHILDMAKLRRAANHDKAALVDAYTATDTGLRNVIEAVTARAAAAEAHVVELTTKCDGLTAANSLLEAQLVGLQSTADEHQVEVRCLENLLHASELHVLDLSSREASAVDVSTVLQSKIDKLAANLRTAVTESYECKQRHDELARMNQGLVNADTQQKSDLVALQVVQASAQELHALAVKKDAVIARLRDELAAAKTDAERAIAEAVRTRQDALDAASMEQEAARMQLVDDVAAADSSTNLPNLLFVDGDDFAADLQRLEDDLAASKAELAKAATAAASSQATIEALSADKLRLIATVQEQKAGLAAMSLQLRSAVARTDASTQQIESLLGEKSHLTSVVQQRDAAIAVFKAEIAEAVTAAASSQATIEALSADKLQLIATVQEQKAGLAAMTLQLEKAVVCMNASSHQIESLLCESSCLASEIEQQKTAMAAAKAALDHTKAVLDRIESELNHTKTDLNTTKAASQERADACTRMCSTLKAEKDHLHMAMVQLSNDLGAAKKAIALHEQATDANQQQIEALLCETRRLTSMVEQQEAAKSELADAATASTLLLEATIQEKTDALAATTLQLHAATTCVDTQTQQIETLLGNKTELTSVLQQLQADLDASSTALALAQDAVAASAQQNEALMAANSHLVHTNAQLTADVATATAEAARIKASSDDVADASAKHAARVNASKARLLETIKTLQHTLATQAPMVCDQCTHWKGLLAQSSTVIGSLRTELAAALERATAPADVVRAFFERVHATFPILRYSAIEVLIDGIYGGDTRVFEATDGFQVFPHC